MNLYFITFNTIDSVYDSDGEFLYYDGIYIYVIETDKFYTRQDFINIYNQCGHDEDKFFDSIDCINIYRSPIPLIWGPDVYENFELDEEPELWSVI